METKYSYRGVEIIINSSEALNSVTGRNKEFDLFLVSSSIADLKKKFVQVLNNLLVEKDIEENRFWVIFLTEDSVAAKDYSSKTLPFNVNSPPKVLLVHGEVFLYQSTWSRSLYYSKVDYLQISLPSVIKEQFIREGVL